MSEIFKFPKGYDVVVCRKEDIINCIEDNIIDKDVAFAVIDKCEKDIADLLTKGKWVGIPYLGSIRVPDSINTLYSEETKQLEESAKETLTEEQYAIFKKDLRIGIKKSTNSKRYINYITSKFTNRNRSFYKKLCNTKGELYAKCLAYTLTQIAVVGGDYGQET